MAVSLPCTEVTVAMPEMEGMVVSVALVEQAAMGVMGVMEVLALMAASFC